MNRFSNKKKHRLVSGKLLLSLLLFLVITVVCRYGISSVSASASQAQADSLKRAIVRSAVHCYSMEGAYPESLDYLKENYGITWDSSRYTVDYEILGSNLMPMITIIPLSGMEVPR